MNAPAHAMIGNVEAEAALLGALMQANNAIDRVADRLKPEDFAEPVHGRIYSAIIRQQSLGQAANPITLKPYFDGDAALNDLGGVGYLARLTGSPVSVVGLGDFVEQVQSLAKRRRLVEGLQSVLAATADYEVSVDDLAVEVEVAMAEALAEQDGRTEATASECITDALKALETHDTGVLSGNGAIDAAMGPIRRKNLAILAGRPGMGKTAVALAMARGAAMKGHGVLIVSLEMSSEELGERMVCDLSYDEGRGEGVPYDSLINGNVSRDELRRLVHARDLAEQLPIQVVDVGSLKVGKLATLVRRWKRRFAAKGQSLDLVVVDYLQLLSPDHRVSGPYEAATVVSKALKTIAKQNDLGVLALAQLSREVEKRPDKRPMLSDLRDSGQIEQDADAVMFLLRPEYYLRKTEPHPASNDHFDWQQQMEAVENVIEFICAKRRKGAERTTEGKFYGDYQAVRG